MLANMIRKGLEMAKLYQYPQPATSFSFYEAELVPFSPTQSAMCLLYGKTRLVYNVNFQSVTNGTYFNFSRNGSFTRENYVASPWFEDQTIEDYSSLSLDEAVKLVLSQYPDTHFTFATLRKALQPGIYIPSFYLGSTKGINFRVDFRGNVSIVQ